MHCAASVASVHTLATLGVMLPQPVRIEVVDGVTVVIEWDDGAISELAAPGLRAACQCAGCREPAGAAEIEALLGSPVPVTISDAKLVGGYAVSFTFGPDGHGTGIYPFAALYELGSGPD